MCNINYNMYMLLNLFIVYLILLDFNPERLRTLSRRKRICVSFHWQRTPRQKHPCASTVLPRKRQDGQKNVPGWRTGHRPVIPDRNILHDLSFSGRTGNTGVLRRGLRRTAHLLFREEQETSHIQSSSLRLGIRLNSLVLCVTTMRSLASPCAAICIS